MNSGLEWEEAYDKICDATKMLFIAEDMGRVQLENQPLLLLIRIGITPRELVIYCLTSCVSNSKRIKSTWIFGMHN